MWKGDKYWQLKEASAKKVMITRILYLVGGITTIVTVFWLILHISGGLERGGGDAAGGPPTAFSTRGANTWEEVKREAATQDAIAFDAIVAKHCGDACQKRAKTACADLCKDATTYIRAHISVASLKGPHLPKECRNSCTQNWAIACESGCKGDDTTTCLRLASNDQCDKPCQQKQTKHRNRPMDMRRVFVQACTHGCKAGIKWSCGIAAEDRAGRLAEK